MSVSKTNRENKISFLNIDWNAVDRDIKAQKEATETRRACNKSDEKVELAKQTSGSLYKQQYNSKMNFLDPNSVPKPEARQETHASLEAAKKLNSKHTNDNLRTMTDKSVFSARVNDVTDDKSSRKSPNTSRGGIVNSIFDSNAIARLVSESNKEKTSSEKTKIAQQRKDQENKKNSDLAETLRSIDQRKAANVAPASVENRTSGYYRKPTNGMSLFDNGDFERIPQNTRGEKVAENKRNERSANNDSLPTETNVGKQVTAKDVMSRLFKSYNKDSE